MRWSNCHLLHAVLAAVLLGAAVGSFSWSTSMAAPQPRATPVPPRPIVTPTDLELARRQLESATSGLQRVEVLLVAVSVFLTAFGIVAVLTGYFVVRNWAEKKAEETASSQISKEIAHVFSGLSYIEWARASGEEGISLAITLGERALSIAEESKDERRIAIAKTNLAYYYAHAEIQDKKEVALDYAHDAKAHFSKIKRPSLLANDIFVRMKFANNCDEETLRPLKKEADDLIQRHPSIANELKQYVDQMIKKCPALGRA